MGDTQSTQIQYKTQSIGLLLPGYSLVTNQSYFIAGVLFTSIQVPKMTEGQFCESHIPALPSENTLPVNVPWSLNLINTVHPITFAVLNSLIIGQRTRMQVLLVLPIVIVYKLISKFKNTEVWTETGARETNTL